MKLQLYFLPGCYGSNHNMANKLDSFTIAKQFTFTGNCMFESNDINEKNPTRYFKTVVEGYLLCIIGFLGTFGSIFGIVVLCQPSMSSNINVILIGKH